MHLTLYSECRDGRHDECPGAHPAPKGVFGGSRCTCSCHKPKVERPKFRLGRLPKLHLPPKKGAQ